MLFHNRGVIALWCLIVGGPHADLGSPAQAAAGQHKRIVECAALGALQLTGVRITEAVAIAAPEKGPVTVAHCGASSYWRTGGPTRR
jgi:hypothetical protein